MSKLVEMVYKNTSQVIDGGVYQMFGHFLVTSVLLFIVSVALGILIGSVLLALALGSFVWALLAVMCVKYCELATRYRGGLQP